MRAKSGTCKLCLANSKLCASHIVPEFCYEYNGPSNARSACYVELPTSGLLREMVVQIGHREHLLCGRCEQLVGKYEDAFARYWGASPELKAPTPAGAEVVLHGAPYHEVKLFVLSVFWRASVSTLFGREMHLGSYGEKLRRIVLDGDRVSEQQYLLVAKLILGEGGLPLSGYVDTPLLVRHDHIWRYRMAFACCEWHVIMCDHPLPQSLHRLAPSVMEDGDIHLIAVPSHELPALKHVRRLIQVRMNASPVGAETGNREERRLASNDGKG